MRLTLRTMLAYVNDLLEPENAEELGKKIAESEFATSLMHRMRDVTRRLRLGAPRLHGRGMGNDPNTVAEYLDNRLPSDRVADFEKVCLESDVHLAEVASCHQILALVLGEPAEIETASRQRMYALPQQAEATIHPPAPSKRRKRSRDEAGRESRRKKKRRKVAVPEYLREPASAPPTPRRWGGLLAAAAVLIAIGIGLTGYRYRADLARLLPTIQPDEASDTRIAANSSATDGERNGAGAPSASAENAGPDEHPAGGDQPDQPTSAPATDDNAGEQDKRPDGSETDSAFTNDDSQRDDMAAGREASVAPPTQGAEPGPRQPAANRPQPAEIAADGRRMPREDGLNRPARGGPRPTTKPATKPATNEPARAAVVGEGIGRLISEHDVMLREVGDDWHRVPTRGTVHASERLIALPTYRPSIAMSSGITLQLLGGAIVSLGPIAEDGGAQIHLSTGRVLLLTASKPDTIVHLKAGDYEGTIEFGEGDTVLAVEVRQLLPEGVDPEQEPAPTAVELYLSSGAATWVGHSGKGERLSGRAHRTLAGDGAASASDELPAWIESNQLNPNERRAASDVAGYLTPDKPVATALEELAVHRRLENTVLAVQSLALIDDFEPIVPLLNDAKYHNAWTWQIESLRGALARGPRVATAMREAFQRARGREPGSALYRMLWGYSEQQLRDGAAAQLIDWLAAPDDQLDFRVLSFWNLSHITGMKLYYQPTEQEKARRQSIQRWKQKLDAGLIVPKAA